MKTPSMYLDRFIIKFNNSPNNKVLTDRLKELLYKDLSMVLFTGIRFYFPYFIVDVKEKVIFILPKDLNFSYKMYQTSCDLAIILQLIQNRSIEDDLLDTPYSC
jgi:hypothetical protein